MVDDNLIIAEATYYIDNKSTFRRTAEKFKVSKSTVHNDLRIRLKNIDVNLYNEVKNISDNNYSCKHIRGGLSTKLKYYTNKEDNKNE